MSQFWVRSGIRFSLGDSSVPSYTDQVASIPWAVLFVFHEPAISVEAPSRVNRSLNLDEPVARDIFRRRDQRNRVQMADTSFPDILMHRRRKASLEGYLLNSAVFAGVWFDGVAIVVRSGL